VPSDYRFDGYFICTLYQKQRRENVASVSQSPTPCSRTFTQYHDVVGAHARATSKSDQFFFPPQRGRRGPLRGLRHTVRAHVDDDPSPSRFLTVRLSPFQTRFVFVFYSRLLTTCIHVFPFATDVSQCIQNIKRKWTASTPIWLWTYWVWRLSDRRCSVILINRLRFCFLQKRLWRLFERVVYIYFFYVDDIEILGEHTGIFQSYQSMARSSTGKCLYYSRYRNWVLFFVSWWHRVNEYVDRYFEKKKSYRKINF